MVRLARLDQPRVFPLRQIQRATSQRIDANLANQGSRNQSEVIVGALRGSRQSRRATLRFWFVLVALLAASIGFFLVILREVERLFGL